MSQITAAKGSQKWSFCCLLFQTSLLSCYQESNCSHSSGSPGCFKSVQKLGDTVGEGMGMLDAPSTALSSSSA